MLELMRPVFAIIAPVCVSASGVQAQEWLVQRATKQVQFTVDELTWQVVQQGQTIPNKAWISTGPRGRAVLTRGQEQIEIQPESLAAILTTGYLTRKTDVVQQTRKLVLEIEKRCEPHTYVHTRYLAAVVKGTTSKVKVTAKQATALVEEGLVEVTSFTGGQRTNVGVGQRATVNEARRMSVAGAIATPSSTSPRAASVPALGQPTPIGREPANTAAGTAKEAANLSSPNTARSSNSKPEGIGNGDGSGNGGGNGRC